MADSKYGKYICTELKKDVPLPPYREWERDMIGGGGTIYELARKLIRSKGIKELYIGAGHNLCLPEARERLEELYREGSLKSLITTDSVPQTQEFRKLPFIKIHGLDDIFCRTINRVHYNRSVSELFLRE